MKRFLTLFLVIAIMIAAPALAKNDKGNGHGRGKGKHDGIEWNDDNGHHGRGKSKGRDDDRDILRGYVLGHYKKHCPPGLAKKNPPCIPPGQAKKFGHGDRLPERGWSYVPRSVVELLSPALPGTRYVRLDKNVYLMAEGTRKVVEAFELFSAID